MQTKEVVWLSIALGIVAAVLIGISSYVLANPSPVTSPDDGLYTRREYCTMQMEKPLKDISGECFFMMLTPESK